MGVSGGAKGALEGPSMMPGGTKASYDAIESLVTKMAAQVEDGPCVTYIGPGGSGHFVKTEGVISAAAMRALGGHFQGQLVYDPAIAQTSEWADMTKEGNLQRLAEMGITDPDKVYEASELACGEHVVFAGSGITDGLLFNGVKFEADCTRTSITVGFLMLTVGIISGAVWANEAWGSYWSWDPKETWALICWLVYAAYLHTRLSRGWQGRRPALVAVVGLIVIAVCYIGVNLLGIGLHSYGWFF